MGVKVQSKAGTISNGNSSGSVTLDSSSTSGNVLLVSLAVRQNAGGTLTATVTDNKSNSFANSVPVGGGAFTRDVQISLAFNITGGSSHQITVTLSDTVGTDANFTVTEVSGISTTSPADKSAQSVNGFSNSPSSGNTATLAQADEFVFGALYYDGAGVVSDGGTYTRDLANGVVYTEYKNVAATTAVAADWSLDTVGNWSAAVLTLKNGAAANNGNPAAILSHF